jgi:hypothetical protein
MRFLVCLVVGILSCSAALPAEGVNDADASLAMRIASGLANSAPPDVARADVAASEAEGSGRRVTIVDAVLLLRGARGQAPAGVRGSGLLALHDEVALHRATERNYTLARAYRITGRLVDASGNPLSGAVSLGNNTDSQKGFSMVDRSGEFSMAVGAETVQPYVSVDFPTRDGTRTIHATMRLPKSEALTPDGDARRDFVRPERPPTGFVTGTITAGDVTVVQVTVTVQMGEQVGGSIIVPVTDGHYRAECPAGTATLLIETRSGERRSSPVVFTERDGFDVSSGQTVVHDLTLPRLVRLAGSIEGGPDWPITQVFLTNWTSRGLWIGSRDSAPARSGFLLPAEPGPHRANVAFAKREDTSYVEYVCPIDLTVPERGGRTTLTLPPGRPEQTFTGKVTDPSGHPVTGGRITLSTRTIGNEKWRVYAYTVTGADGRYRFTVPDGSYFVHVEPLK